MINPRMSEEHQTVQPSPSREQWTAAAIVLLVVLARSLVFVFWEQSYYDSDQAIVGLMAKHLGKVPIPGSRVEVGGLVFVAEEAKGRRNRIGTVLISRALAATRSDIP